MHDYDDGIGEGGARRVTSTKTVFSSLFSSDEHETDTGEMTCQSRISTEILIDVIRKSLVAVGDKADCDERSPTTCESCTYMVLIQSNGRT